jgi:predicted nucleotidyltransferase
VPPASDPASLLRALAQALATHGCRWYLFGAQAVTLWGRPRLTTDVDVTVEIASDGSSALVAALSAAGFRLSDAFSDAFVRSTRVLPLIHVESSMPLDVVLAGPGLEEQFLDRVVLVQVGDVTVPVISPEDLVVTKALAGREKDTEDIRGILRLRRDSLDLVYIRRTLQVVEEALGQSDLTPLFETEWARAASRGQHE